ncbi:MAG TPA: hypothetical protein VK425_03045, partial [Acidimicrobiales bacterium]|nr:hypothetical protein [Acidimicrobiales bacterium]
MGGPAAQPLAPPGTTLTRKLPAKPWLPAVVAVLPLIMECVRTVVGRGQIFFWGDQALIDLEARDTVLGRNLLGVYDRYGWHHLGPVWLGVLGAARWVGGGSRLALVL